MMLRAILTLIGGVVIQISLGTSYIFGNYTPYFTSYLRNRTSSREITYADATWVSAAGSTACFLLLPLVQIVLEKRVHFKILIAVSCLLLSGNMMATYYTVKEGVIAFTTTYSVNCLSCQVVAYVAILKCTMAWFPKHSSLISGIVLSGYGFSSFLFNWMITLYINPNNLTPDLQVGEDTYFTQKELLDRVPESFLVLGATLLGLQVIGFFLLSDSEKYLKKDDRMLPDVNDCDDGSMNDGDDMTGSVNTSKHDVSKGTEEGKLNVDGAKDMLKSKLFYLLWLMNLFMGIGVGISFTSYKTYGQTFIDNDDFLALTGSTSSIFNGAGRLVWGAVAQKTGKRVLLCILLAGFTISLATINYTEMLVKYFYLIWVCFVYAFFSGIYALMPPVILDIYPTRVYMTAYSLVRSSSIIGNFAASFLAASLQPVIGWGNVFLVSAGTVGIAFILSIMIDREASKVIKNH